MKNKKQFQTTSLLKFVHQNLHKNPSGKAPSLELQVMVCQASAAQLRSKPSWSSDQRLMRRDFWIILMQLLENSVKITEFFANLSQKILTNKHANGSKTHGLGYKQIMKPYETAMFWAFHWPFQIGSMLINPRFFVISLSPSRISSITYLQLISIFLRPI